MPKMPFLLSYHSFLHILYRKAYNCTFIPHNCTIIAINSAFIPQSKVYIYLLLHHPRVRAHVREIFIFRDKKKKKTHKEKILVGCYHFRGFTK